jgi:TP901 family phage tail tape measure protein
MAKTFAVDLKINVKGKTKESLEKISKGTEKVSKGMDKVKRGSEGVKKAGSKLARVAGALTRASQKLNRASKKIGEAGKKLRGHFAGGAMGVGIVAGLGAVANKWETALAKISTMTKMSMKEVEEKWGSDIKRIALKTGQPLGEVAESFYGALSRQIKKSDLVSTVEAIGKASVAGFGTMQDTMKGSIAGAKAFGQTVPQMINKMLIAQEEGATDLGQLSQVIGNLGATFGSIDVPVDQVLSAVSAMTILGSTTGEASTSLNAFFSSALTKGGKANKILKQLGIKFTTTTIKDKGIAGSVKFLFDRINLLAKGDKEQATQMISSLFRRKEAFKAFSQLANKEGQKISNKTLKRMGSDVTALERNFKKMGGTLAFKRLKIQIQILAITIGQALLPVLKPIFKMVGQIGKAVGAFIKRNKRLVKIIVTVTMVIIGNGYNGYNRNKTCSCCLRCCLRCRCFCG